MCFMPDYLLGMAVVREKLPAHTELAFWWRETDCCEDNKYRIYDGRVYPCLPAYLSAIPSSLSIYCISYLPTHICLSNLGTSIF